MDFKASLADDTLREMISREIKWPYAVFLDENNLSVLLQCYNSFDKSPNAAKGDRDAFASTTASPNQFTSLLQECRVRTLIVSFLLDIADHYGEEREVVAVAMGYLDRYLLTRFRQDDENVLIAPSALRSEIPGFTHNRLFSTGATRILDMYALVCLGIAIKVFSPTSGCPVRGRAEKMQCQGRNLSQTGEIETILPPEDDTSSSTTCGTLRSTHVYNGCNFESLTQIAAGIATSIDLANIESLVLSTLQFCLHPVTSFAIVRQVFKLISLELSVDELPSTWRSIIGVSFFQLELSLKDTKVLKYEPSIAAAAALGNSIQRHLNVMICSNSNVSQKSYLNLQVETSRIRNLVYRIEMALKVSFEFDENISSLRGMLLDHWKLNHAHKTRDQQKVITSSPLLLLSKVSSNVTASSASKKKGQKNYAKQPLREMLLIDAKQESYSDRKTHRNKSKKLVTPLQHHSSRPATRANDVRVSYDENNNTSSGCSWIDPLVLGLDLSSNYSSSSKNYPKVLPRLQTKRGPSSHENADLIRHYNEEIRPMLYSQETNEINDGMKEMSLSSRAYTYRTCKASSSKSEQEQARMQHFITTKLTPRNAQDL